MLRTPRLVLAAFVLASVPASSEAPTLAPQAGARVTRTLEQSSEMWLDSWHVVWNGAPVPEQFLPELEVEVSARARAEVEDEYLACEQGRVQRLRREILEARSSGQESAGVSGEDSDSSVEREGQSPLEGCVVLFEAGGEERTLLEGEGPDEALAALVLDLDLLELVDPRGVERSEQGWELELRALAPLELVRAFAIEERSQGDADERADAEQLAANALGTWRVRPDGVREEDGLELLVLAVEGSVATHAERLTDLAEVPIVDGAARERSEQEYEYEGEILWDPQAGRLHSARFEARLTMTVTVTRILEGVEGEATYEQVMDFAGESSLSLVTRAEP